MMQNTDSFVSRTLAQLLAAHGVSYVVASPGSRNAPLLVALSRTDGIKLRMVVDERSAAFVALGLALVANKPVALVCTSGTALLNYAPAVAEAFYRKVPLVVVSADRPREWIDQDDSQTIVQPGALANYVKRSYDLPVDNTEADRWYANRLINDALLACTSGRKAPVHLNIQLGEPLGGMVEYDNEVPRTIRLIEPAATLTTAQARELGRSIASPRRVMIVAGFLQPDKTLNRALNRLAELPNVVVLTETISNLHGRSFITGIDSTLASMDSDKIDRYCPDVVITLGGALVSRHIKQFLRTHSPQEHWHVGITRTTIDCFKALTTRIELRPEVFFPLLASAMQPHRQPSTFADDWAVLADKALSIRQSFAAKAPWSDLKAFAVLLPMVPRRWNVHFSNGTSIRYAQIFGEHEYHRCDCNRGVSGIDGCTSTALGASLAYSDTTLLITGDMSAQYDIGALGSCNLSPRLKIIVIDNGGGGIFRFIGSTSDLDIREECFCVPTSTPWSHIAAGYGLAFFRATSEEELRREFPRFRDVSDRPAILVVDTPAELSAEVLKKFFKR